MTTLKERLTQLRGVLSEERELRRGELIDIAVQAVDVFEQRVGAVWRPAGTALISRIHSLRANGREVVAEALDAVRSAAVGSVASDSAWQTLHEAARRCVEACAAETHPAEQRTVGAPELKNHVLVEATGETRTFGLWHGDVTQSDRADLIIASAYTAFDGSMSGQVAREIQRRFSVSLAHAPFLHLDEDATTTYVAASVAHPAFLILSVPVAADRWAAAEWALHYPLWVRGCFASLAALEVLGSPHQHVAMPVLFGNRTPPSSDAMRVLIRESTEWLRRSRACRDVRLTVFLRSEVEAWSDAMDEALGRVVVHAPDDAEVARYRKCLIDWHAKASPDEAAAIGPLRDALKNPDDLRAAPICNAARQAAEAFSKEWQLHLKKSDVKTNLNSAIEAIQKDAPPMVAAHLHVLRLIGNAFSHLDPNAMNGGTAASAAMIAEALRSVWVLTRLRPQLKA